MSTENCRRSSTTGDHYCNTSAYTGLVATDPTNDNCSSNCATKTPGPSNIVSLAQKASPSKDENDYAGMFPVWQSIKGKRISEAACKLIMASWRSGTRKQYSTYMQQWMETDYLHPTVKVVLEFLTNLYEKGLSYSTVNTARSALSSLVILPIAADHTKLNLLSHFYKVCP
jgi:hypothetical protein